MVDTLLLATTCIPLNSVYPDIANMRRHGGLVRPRQSGATCSGPDLVPILQVLPAHCAVSSEDSGSQTPFKRLQASGL